MYAEVREHVCNVCLSVCMYMLHVWVLTEDRGGHWILLNPLQLEARVIGSCEPPKVVLGILLLKSNTTLNCCVLFPAPCHVHI